LSKTNLILRRAPFVVVAEKQSEAEIFFAFAVHYLNDTSAYYGGAVFSQDRQFFRMKDRRSGRTLLEFQKLSPELFGKLLRSHMVHHLKPGTRLVNGDLVDAAVARHLFAENRRKRANLRYERNLVATKRTEEAILQALEDRLRFRMKVEDAAHWVNEQLTRFKMAGEQTYFAGRNTHKLSRAWRPYDSITVYDYRDMWMYYTWRRGLPCPVFNGHLVDSEGKDCNRIRPHRKRLGAFRESTREGSRLLIRQWQPKKP
jgi:hypothetical protein